MSTYQDIPEEAKIGVVVLAAGASTRLGKPKQLLRLQGETLLRRAARTAVESHCKPVIVVLGASAQEIRPEVDSLGIHSVENTQWSEGLSSSLRTGLEALMIDSPQIEAVIFMLCDQPLVTAGLLDQLAATYRLTGAPIVASEYSGTLGTPALFARSLFPELLALRGASGAKQVIAAHREAARSVPFPDGATDVDTQHEYEKLQG